MFKTGDVVLGSFATANGCILNHYSIVMKGNNDGAMLVYATSIKCKGVVSNVFSREDLMLAGLATAGRWDASIVSLVPNQLLRKVGCISKATMARILKGFEAACAQRTVSAASLSLDNKVTAL